MEFSHWGGEDIKFEDNKLMRGRKRKRELGLLYNERVIRKEKLREKVLG